MVYSQTMPEYADGGTLLKVGTQERLVQLWIEAVRRSTFTIAIDGKDQRDQQTFRNDLVAQSTLNKRTCIKTYLLAKGSRRIACPTLRACLAVERTGKYSRMPVGTCLPGHRS